MFDNQSNILFDKQHQRATTKKMVANVIGLPVSRPILSLHDVLDSHRAGNRHFAGTASIDVSQIHGTVDRNGDFDYDFAPLRTSDKQRWCNVAKAMLHGEELPAIDLIQVGEHYFVKDGHHRVSVARALGVIYIDASIDIWK